MSSNSVRFPLLALLVLGGCGGSKDDAPESRSLPISVNGGQCAQRSYANKPCVSVTVCTAGQADCQTLSDILLDSGSVGLRVFKQALGLSLPQVASGAGVLAECVQFADGSSEWGPVERATVVLADLSAQDVPIHVVDSTFGTAPPACAGAEVDPIQAGLTGILGVGVFVHDCGPACARFPNNGVYYSCQGASCRGAVAPISDQVANPVARLPEANNGVVVRLPAVPPGGSAPVEGTLLLGLDQVSGLTALPLDSSGEFLVSYDGKRIPGFVDTGSNALFIPAPSGGQLPSCPSPNEQWYCPPSEASLSATNLGASGSPSERVDFRVTNFIELARSRNPVFSDLAGTLPSLSAFDWGLPFFFGRDVAVGFEGRRSPLGARPFIAH